MKQGFKQWMAVFVLGFTTTLITQAQQSRYDIGRPFGWAVCTSLTTGDDYSLKGGENGSMTTLKSSGKDMRNAITKALQQYDIVILDGSNGPFVVSKTMEFSALKHKTLKGIHGATLKSKFEITPEIRLQMDKVGVRQKSTSGGGGILSNGTRIREEAEFTVRQQLIDMLDDPKETFRHTGLIKMNGCEDFIIENIRFEGPGSIDVSGDDLLSIQNETRHVWVDHCDFLDGMDGNFDISSRADFISVTWCTFGYTEKSFMHQNSNLIGSSDNPSQGIDNLNVTFAFCRWGEGCNQRMPMVRFGTIHLLNNYYDCVGNAAAVNPRMQSEVLVEKNYFEKGVKSIFKQHDAKAWVLKGNIFCESFKTENRGKVQLPYSYKAIAAKKVPEEVKRYAGVCDKQAE